MHVYLWLYIVLAAKTVSRIKGLRVLSIGFRNKNASYASFSQRNWILFTLWPEIFLYFKCFIQNIRTISVQTGPAFITFTFDVDTLTRNCIHVCSYCICVAQQPTRVLLPLTPTPLSLPVSSWNQQQGLNSLPSSQTQMFIAIFAVCVPKQLHNVCNHLEV